MLDKFFLSLERFFKKEISRSTFLKILVSGIIYMFAQNKLLKNLFAASAESGPRKKRPVKTMVDLAVCEGKDPYQNTVKVVEALGGISRFVRKGDVVVVKPNIAWDRTPEQAANTQPQVVAALVQMCYQAGAKRVNIFDITCNDQRRTYERSGIKKAAEEKGAKVYFVDAWNVVKAKFPYESKMQDWPIIRDAVACDCFINVPVLKHHGLTRLTLSMKNLMGVCTGPRGQMHRNIGPMLVDLTDYISPDLNVVDATRVLTRHGPSGGNLADVVTLNKVIASADATLADVYAAKLMKVEPADVPYLQEAALRKFGKFNLQSAKIKEINN